MTDISVIVPVYKVEKYIHRCVNSILNQTSTDYELILVDDGSPDQCGEICDAYAEKDSRIRVIHKENGGLSSARNAGIDIAVGNYLLFIDSDDYVHPQAIELLYKGLVDSQADISMCGLIRVGDESIEFKYIDKISSEKCTNLEALSCLYSEKSTEYVVSCAKLYKKELFSDITFPVGRIHEDVFTTYKLFYKSNKIVCLNQPLYYYYTNPSSIMNNGFNLKRLDALDAFCEQIGFYQEKGIECLRTLSVYSYINHLISLLSLVKSDLHDKIVEKDLKKHLQTCYKKEKKNCNITIETCPCYYMYKFPLYFKLTRLFYNLKTFGIINTIKKVISKLKYGGESCQEYQL